MGEFRYRARARARHVPGRMNKLEAAYAAELDIRLRAGDLRLVMYEGLKLKLAERTFLTPDFFVVSKDGEVELHEVKGFMEDDAAVKLKFAAALFPFRFVLVKVGRERKSGQLFMTEDIHG